MAQFVGDVFGLNAVYDKQLENIANGNFASWPEGATYGYFAGGQPPNTGISSIDRLDFFTEVLSSPGTPLGRNTNEFDGFSSSLYGYFGGGDSPTTPSASNVDRLDFSTETISNPGNYLSPARQTLAATSNTSYGYFVGGVDGSTGSLVSTITRFDFSNETLTNSPTRNLPTTISDLAATSSSSYGYFAGGSNATPRFANVRSSISRLDFSSDVVSSTTPLSPSRCSLAAVSNSAYGYFGGGQISIPASISTISTIDFSTDNLRFAAFLPATISLLSATSDNFHGYFAGGVNVNPIISNIYRLDFSNSTVSDSNPLSIARNSLAALSGGQSVLRGKGFKTYGYFAAGNPKAIGANSSSIDRLNFSTETVSTVTTLPTDFFKLTALSSNFYGYFAGGESPGTGSVTVINRIDFSNETVKTTNSFLLSNRSDHIAATESSSYGYFGGGQAPAATKISTVTRIDFSNETVTDPGKTFPSPLASGSRSFMGAASNNSYGYFGGGDTPAGNISTITRLDFSTEILTNLGSYLPNNTGTVPATTETNFYGYFAGDNSSNIIRFDFSSGTASTLSAIFSTTRRSDCAATSSSSYGYYGAGSPGPTSVSTITRLNFFTETISDLTANLSESVEKLASISNSN